jgi:hypothetical protein
VPPRVELIAASIPLLDNIKTQILNPLIYLAFAAAFLVFGYGVVEFIRHADSDEGRETGGRHILWGVVGMFIMASAFGIINLICAVVYCRG